MKQRRQQIEPTSMWHTNDNLFQIVFRRLDENFPKKWHHTFRAFTSVAFGRGEFQCQIVIEVL